jgi:hypothetical protein
LDASQHERLLARVRALAAQRGEFANRTLRMAKAVRRMTEPVEVDLRGAAAGGEFWAGQQAEAR